MAFRQREGSSKEIKTRCTTTPLNICHFITSQIESSWRVEKRNLKDFGESRVVGKCVFRAIRRSRAARRRSKSGAAAVQLGQGPLGPQNYDGVQCERLPHEGTLHNSTFKVISTKKEEKIRLVLTCYINTSLWTCKHERSTRIGNTRSWNYYKRWDEII